MTMDLLLLVRYHTVRPVAMMNIVVHLMSSTSSCSFCLIWLYWRSGRVMPYTVLEYMLCGRIYMGKQLSEPSVALYDVHG